MPKQPKPVCYRPSGRLRWGRLLLWLFPLAAVAAATAWVLHKAFEVGWYFLFFTPFLAAAPLFGLLYWALWSSHSRSRLVGSLVAGFLCLTAFLGQYYVAFVAEAGPANAHRIDFLPLYIQFRMATEVVQDVNLPDNAPPPQFNQRQTYMNWARLVFEALAIAACGIAIAFSVARSPYCESCQTWTRTWTTGLPLATAQTLIELARHQRVADFTPAPPAVWLPEGASCRLTLDYCPHGGPAAQCAAYLSIDNLAQQGGPFAGNAPKRLLNRACLAPDELAALKRHWPELPAGAAAPAGGQAAALTLDRAEPPHLTGPVADFVPLPEAERGRILTRGHIFVASILGLSPLLLLVGGIGLFAFAAMRSDALSTAAMIGCLVGGFGMLGVTAFYFIYFGDYLPSRYFHSLTRRELDGRSGRWVNPDDPDAIYVQLIPRENWARMMVENAADVGFLAIDHSRGELRYEGDQERFRIPAAAIQSCTIEAFSQPTDTSQFEKFYMTVLRCRTNEGIREVLMSQRHVKRERRGNAGRLKLAEELTEQIASLTADSPRLAGAVTV